jgi:hypothetical protein
MERLDRDEHGGVHGCIVGSELPRPYDRLVLDAGCTIGVLGGHWRATVTPWGAISLWDEPRILDWFVAADDRWHAPSSEPSIRQTRLDGTAVVETRLRVPQGDVAQRVYAVADHGGLTVIEVRNESPLPVAVAFAGAAVLSHRPPADVPIQGIDLPGDTVVFPIGHHATVTVALAHAQSFGRGSLARLPPAVPSAEQVARGWSATCDRASRLVLPDETLVQAAASVRCELALAGAFDGADLAADPVGFLLAVDQLVRMVGMAEPWMPDVARAVEAIARSIGREVEPTDETGELTVALDAAATIARRADDALAERDLDNVRARISALTKGSAEWLPEPSTQKGARLVTALERRCAAGGDVLPAGMPPAWFGQNFEVHGVPTGPGSSLSYAVRWHGDHPAILWECTGDRVVLTSSHLAPGWSSREQAGEALWPAFAMPTASFG